MSVRTNRRAKAGPDWEPPPRTRFLSAKLGSFGPPFSQYGQPWLWPVATESKEDRRSHPKINHGPEWVNRKLGQRRGLVRVWKERELCLSWEDERSLPAATALCLCCAPSCPQAPDTQCIFSAEFWPLGLTLLPTWTPLSLRKDLSLHSMWVFLFVNPVWPSPVCSVLPPYTPLYREKGREQDWHAVAGAPGVLPHAWWMAIWNRRHLKGWMSWSKAAEMSIAQGGSLGFHSSLCAPAGFVPAPSGNSILVCMGLTLSPLREVIQWMSEQTNKEMDRSYQETVRETLEGLSEQPANQVLGGSNGRRMSLFRSGAFFS